MQKIAVLWSILILLSGCSRTDDPFPPGNGKVLVLMYHKIVAGTPASEYERSLAKFEEDLKYIVNNRYNTLLFSDLKKILRAGEMPAVNSLVLTFDDGDESWYTLVRPLLLKYRMKATFFLCTDMIGVGTGIGWHEIEEMSGWHAWGEAPFQFGSHTVSHSYLLKSRNAFETLALYESFLDHELGESKEIIDGHIPGEISSLSLPYGDGANDSIIIAAAKRNKYRLIRTSKWGNIASPEFNPYSIPSLPVLDTTSVRFIDYYLNR